MADEINAFFSRIFDERTAFYDELENGSPRAAAILAVSSLDAELEDFILWKRFPRDTPEQEDQSRDQAFTHGPLNSFWAKIQIGQALGLYGDQTRLAMIRMGEIRNRFAHYAKVSFQDDFIMDRCRLLGFVKAVPNPTEGDIRFFFIHRVRDLHELIEEHRYHVPLLDRESPAPLG